MTVRRHEEWSPPLYLRRFGFLDAVEEPVLTLGMIVETVERRKCLGDFAEDGEQVEAAGEKSV